MKKFSQRLVLQSLFNKNFSFQNKHFFSTLIVPDINNETGKVNSSYSILLKAAEDLKSKNSVLLYGDKVSEDLIKSVSYYVENVYVAEHSKLKNPTSEYLSTLVAQIQKENNFAHIITPSSNFGRNFLPRVGGLLNIEPIADVNKIISSTSFQRYIYAGNALSTVESSQKSNLISIRLTSFEGKELKDASSPKVNKVDTSSLDGIKSAEFVENMITKSDKPELGSAKVVISGGRALKSGENFKMLDDLASCFKGAAIGASRAAVDAGFVGNDLQVGQTGKTVAPELYVAIGISGAIQHIAGMKDSKCIVAINTDADAPIFNVSFIQYYTLNFIYAL